MPFGGTVSADDYRTGTIAAAVGGTTTVIDFALQSTGPHHGEALETWLAKSDGKACIDYGLHMAVTDLGPGDGAQGLAEMETMVAKGISSFKLFMAYPNVLMIDDGLMFKVMHKAGTLNALCCVHAENGSVIDIVVARMIAEGKTAPHYHAHSRSAKRRPRPRIAPSTLRDMAGAAVYIVHLSNEDALRELKHAQQRGLRALAETCPQYLVLSLEEHMPGKSWEEAKYVFTPPLREKHNQAPLWKALEDGTLSVVSTDHCPFRFADQKSLGKDDFTKIPNGGPGIENRLQILWQFGVNAGRAHAGEVCRALLHGAGTHLRHAAKGSHRCGQGCGYPALGPQRLLHHHRRYPAHGDRLLHVRRLGGVGERQACLLSRRAGGQRRRVDRADRARALPQARSQCRRVRLMARLALDLAVRTRSFTTRPRAYHTGESYLGHLQLHRSVVLHVDGGHHLHACLFADCRRHELEAGDLHHPAGQPDRARAHAAERARRRQVRHSLPRLRARQLRRAGSEYSRHAARPGGLRMVRHSVLVGRPGDRGHDRRRMAGDSTHARCVMGELSRLLAAEHVRRLVRR